MIMTLFDTRSALASRSVLQKTIIASLAIHAAALAVSPHLSKQLAPPAPRELSVTLLEPKPVVTPAALPASTPRRAQPVVRPAPQPVPQPIVRTTPPTPAAAPVAVQEAPAAPVQKAAPAPDTPPAPKVTAAPPPALAARTDDAPDNAALEGYGHTLSALMARHQQYPRLAQMRRWQGKVQVRLHVAKKGAILDVAITQSSGYEVLDRQALEIVRASTPLPLPPEALAGKEFTVIVPITFKLENS